MPAVDIDHILEISTISSALTISSDIWSAMRCCCCSHRSCPGCADDLLFRLGGEEFVCVIRNVNLGIAESAVNRFRESVQNYNFPQVGQVTVSVGFTQIRPNDLSSSIIDRADEALLAEGKLTSREMVGDIELF